MAEGQNTDIPHRLTKTRLDDAIAHADDQEKEERERIAPCIKYGDYDHEDFCASVVAVDVGEVY